MELSAWAIAGISIFAVFVGATIPVITDVFRVQLERKQRIQDRRDDFQRETLLALHEALIQRGVLGAEIHAMAHAGDPMSQELLTKERMALLEVGNLLFASLTTELGS